MFVLLPRDWMNRAQQPCRQRDFKRPTATFVLDRYKFPIKEVFVLALGLTYRFGEVTI